MKRTKVDIMFIDETRKKRKEIIFAVLIAIISGLFIYSIFNSFARTKTQYVKYNENSDIDYRVYLKDNNFYKEKYLGKDSEYIASLIDYISSQFNYNIHLEQKGIDFKYARRVDAIVEVYDEKGKKPLYKVTEEVLGSKTEDSRGVTDINISENIKIDYNHYNNLISEFKETYGLNTVNSTLTLKMYIDIDDNCSDLLDVPSTHSEISLKIPLTTKIMSIEMESDLVENNDGMLVCKKPEHMVLWWLLTIAILGLDIYVITKLIIFVKNNRTAKDIYRKELKRILSNYHSFIQKVNNNFNLGEYQVLKVDTFTDMLEIRDTIQQPILMVENKEKNGVHFIIPSNTKILYTYSLKESEIRKKLENDMEDDFVL